METKRPLNGGKGSIFKEIKRGSKTVTLEFFSEGHIELHKEITQHPMLMLAITLQAPDGDEGMVLGTIAAFCNVAMDGVYSREQIEDLYPILVDKLRRLRKIVIAPVNVGTVGHVDHSGRKPH